MKDHDQTKRILIISFLFEPDTRVGGKRFSFLSRILKKKYRELHVLTLKEHCILQKDTSLKSAGTIHRAGMYPSYPIIVNTIFKRIFNRLWVDYLCLVDQYSGWILPALLKGFKIIKKNNINLIIVTGPPFSPMVVAFFLSLLTRSKLILDYRDPWSNLHSKYQKPFFGPFNKFCEKMIVGRASALIFCSRIMMENFRANLGKCTRANYFVVTNGFDNQDKIEPLPSANDRKTMVYAGNFYGERKIDLLLKPLFHLLNKGVISKDSFCCFIFGELSVQDRKLIKKYGLNEIIKELTWIPYKQIIKYLKGSDILFLPSGSDVNYAIPFKFFDYLSVKRPILTIAPDNSAMAEMMNQIDCGRFASISDEHSIQENLNAIIKENEYSYSGAEQYTWDKIGEKYMDIIDKI